MRVGVMASPASVPGCADGGISVPAGQTEAQGVATWGLVRLVMGLSRQQPHRKGNSLFPGGGFGVHDGAASGPKAS